MRKKRLLLTLIGTLALVGCDVNRITTKSGEQAIVELNEGKDKEYYTADQLFDSYTATPSGATEYYNAVYNVLIRIAQPETTAINNEVQKSLDSFTESCKTTAQTNGTLYSTELSNALEDKDVESLDELEEQYYLEEKKKVYEETYYDENVQFDYDSKKTSEENKTAFDKTLLSEYVNYYAPYHIRHILVQTSADSSLYAGCISASDAKNLSSVVTRLASGSTADTFAFVAQQTSASFGDSGSAAIYGDVGIMDTTTSFVSEFKYSIYEYDKYVTVNGKNHAAEIKNFDDRQAERTIGNANIGTNAEAVGSPLIPTEAEDKLGAKENKLEVNFIPYQVFESLNTVANIEKNSSGEVVYDGDPQYYPRNYLYNKYLNNHSMGFVEFDSEEQTTKNYSEDRTTKIVVNGQEHTVLCDENENPIIVTKAGSGSGDSGYQGIHFIIIQKSAFDSDVLNGKYYSTTVPTDNDAKKVDSYVTFLNTDKTTYTSRAQTIKDNVKGFDKNISFRIYEKAYEKALSSDANFKIVDEDVKNRICDYIKENRYSTAYSAKETYQNSWEDYTNLLEVQDLTDPLKVPTIIEKAGYSSKIYTSYYTSFSYNTSGSNVYGLPYQHQA